MKRAIVVGGTGLVGRHLLDQLSERRVPTLALARTPGQPRPSVEWRKVDLLHVGAADVPARTDAAFCALGTTIKQAGSQEAFRAVDHGLVLAFAQACRAAGVPQLHVVSAMGASPRSAFFYNRVKGEVERDLKALGFPTLVVYRPSLILGEREARRPGEGLATGVMVPLAPLLPGDLKPIRASTIARAMVLGARAAPAGTIVLSSKQVQRAGS
jgi:uncharacterized protein YbjT (DUF2867 family)